ncbi:substrate-binding domain-containing protein [Myxosarcina sp. GI1(2024)]
MTYIPIPGSEQTIVVVSGTELQEPLEELGTKFEQTHPAIELQLEFQGFQDIINNYLDRKNDFTPTVIIPASEEILEELTNRWQATNNSQPFYNTPQPIAKTILVGIAWAERGKLLFPNNNFAWEQIERAMEKRNWGEIGGQADWGSFDFVITDPTRSNSGQLTLSLWTRERNHNALDPSVFNNASTQSLFTLIKNSVYQPPRSTDILLQEFISRGANDADVAMVYESIALYRWS